MCNFKIREAFKENLKIFTNSKLGRSKYSYTLNVR